LAKNWTSTLSDGGEGGTFFENRDFCQDLNTRTVDIE